MSAYIVCTEERKRDVNYVPNELKQKLQYRVQCVKERSYSTAPITSAINMHPIYTPTFTERDIHRKREREREHERDEKRRKRERESKRGMRREERERTPIQCTVRCKCRRLVAT